MVRPTPPISEGAGFAVLDLETTGLGPTQDRILELAIVAASPTGEIVGEWASRFNPQGRVGASHVHGISAEDVANAPFFSDCIGEIISLMRGRVLVAHNATFDLAFLRSEVERAGWILPSAPAFCTLKASWFYLPDLRSRRLADCCEAVGVQLDSSHVALDDARATAALLRWFLDPGTPPAPLDEHLTLVQHASNVAWPTAPSDQSITTSGPVIVSVRRRSSESIRLSPTLITTLADYSLADALQEGAPEGSTEYLQLLLEVLEDGELTVEEGFALAELAREYGLSPDDVEGAHRGFLVALARRAVEDDHVSREERDELKLVARLLDLPEKLVPDALGGARDQRAVSLGDGLPPLPDDWDLGEPLRVGDRIAITGCEAYGRQALEQRAIERGITIAGGVSKKTALLVSDGTIFGTKAVSARKHGIRVVHPAAFGRLLEHVQPALPRPEKPARSTPATGRRTPESPNGVDPSVIRRWARSNGFDVGTRGRLHQEVIDAYVRAQGSSVLQAEPEGQPAADRP